MLERNPGVVVHYRLLRDVVRVSVSDSALQAAQGAIQSSACVLNLASEQQENGGWGRFHSRDSSLRQHTPCTEAAVDRALALGLDASGSVLEKAATHITRIMDGELAFPDPAERNDRWKTGVRMFLASTLSLIRPRDPRLDSDREFWCEIMRRVFRSGQYSAQDEMRAHAELTGSSVHQDCYLALSGKHPLNILGSIPGTLPEELERLLLQWICQKPNGIGYLSVPLYRPPLRSAPAGIELWMVSLEILARGFPSWACFADEAMTWLWEQRSVAGLWDFGTRAGFTSYFPLSDSWKRRQDRELDWSTRVLVLLGQYCRDRGA